MTTWISHRGYTGSPQSPRASENTAAAFAAAVAEGFTHLETDLRVSRDGHIVLCHDPDLQRVSGRQVAIHQLTRKELTQERLRFGEPLLFFDELLANFSHLDWILDIKPEQAQQTVAILHQMRADPAIDAFLRQRARYLLWDAQHEQQLTSVLPEALCLARDKHCYRAGVAALFGLPQLGNINAGQYYAVPPVLKRFPVLSERIVQHFHRAGAKVIGYLPETAEHHQQALTAGVDQLLTNHSPKILHSLTKE